MLKVIEKTKAEMRIPLAKPILNDEMKKAALEAMGNERLVLGESVYRFEEEFARYCGVKYAVSTNSGTDALQLALIAVGISNGYEVVTTAHSFIASANSVIHAGGTPVLADIDLKTYSIDPAQVRKKITLKTRAILPVHLYGYPAEMDEVNEIASGHGFYVVEDACQAHGAMYKGEKVGSLSDVACFSFYPSKNITTGGDGGAVVTNNEEIAEVVAKLRDCGRSGRYIHDLLGYTARLNTVNAAIGRVQLRYLDRWNEDRRRIAELYNRFLSDLEEVILPPRGNRDVTPVYHLYVIRVKQRDRLREWLEKNGIECGVHYPLPIHLQPIYRRLFTHNEGDFPASEEVAKTCLSIPMYAELSKDEVVFISERIHEFYNTKLQNR